MLNVATRLVGSISQPGATTGPARIGPNAITQLGEAVRQALGNQARCGVFRMAGLEAYLDHPPQEMVEECEVVALHAALLELVGPSEQARISFAAGRRTGDYLLANRIPKSAQTLLRYLPQGLAARLLTRSIAKNAWTFAGSGTFLASPGKPVRLAIENAPLCRPVHHSLCDFYAGTFQRLFEALVSSDTRVHRTHCCSRGEHACRFEISW